MGWIAVGISGLTLIALFLTFLSADYGPLTAQPNLSISMQDNIDIVCKLYAIYFDPLIEIYNDGKKSERIGRMVAYISSSNSKIRKILIPFTYNPYGGNESRSFGSFIVLPGELWNAMVSFSEEFSENQTQKITDLDVQIGEYLQMASMKIKDDKKFKPTLPDHLYYILRDIMQSQVSWLEKGNYRFLLFIIGGKGNNEILFRKAWSFML